MAIEAKTTTICYICGGKIIKTFYSERTVDHLGYDTNKGRDYGYDINICKCNFQIQYLTQHCDNCEYKKLEKECVSTDRIKEIIETLKETNIDATDLKVKPMASVKESSKCKHWKLDTKKLMTFVKLINDAGKGLYWGQKFMIQSKK